MVLNMLLAFFTSLFTGITLHTPLTAWFTVGLTGMLGWSVSRFLAYRNIPELLAAVSGALVIGILAEIFARWQKQPVTVYIVSGIIPLVPGTIFYNSMLQFLDNQYNAGFALAFKAFLIASYLAAGLAIVPLILRQIKFFWSRGKHLEKKR
ncbi:MAG: threonine/serine exporter family protein [Thermincola sp.]|nr:threonine/serine exporter family protein [Thermincola sp.]MDT3701714.1 threonine/serine exporter family protein [Thermincola sp.]